MHPKRSLLAAVAATLILSAAPASASADTSTQASAILSNVAAHVSHGFANYSTTYETDEQIIAGGGRVSVLCGQVSMLGARALQRAGIISRYVGTFASKRADLMDVPADVVESHAMLEVWTGARWELYDLDSNVQPVDAQGRPVTLLQFVDMPQRYYRPIATDELYNPAGDQYPRYEAWVFANHEAWYDRVLDIPAIYQGNGYAYTGPQPSPLQGMPGYAWVTPQALAEYALWAPQGVTTTTPAAPAAPTAAPATAAVAAASPAVAVAAAKPTVKPAAPRFRTVVRRHKVWHVYGKGTHARWVFVRRAR